MPRQADVIMVNPGEIHDGVPLDGNARGWRMLYFEPSFLKEEVEQEIPGAIDVVRPVARDSVLAVHFDRLFTRLTDLQSDPLDREETVLRSLIYILRNHGLARRPSKEPSPLVARAIQRMESAPETSVSLAELAALSNVSRFQLLRGFARETGATPHAYLVQRRVRLVKQLLADGKPPSQAAIQAGFADQRHMTRAFVRQFGITPGCYCASLR